MYYTNFNAALTELRDFRQLIVDNFAQHREESMAAYNELHQGIMSNVEKYVESGAGSSKSKKVDPKQQAIMGQVLASLGEIKYQYPEDALPKMQERLYEGYKSISQYSLDKGIAPGGSATILLEAIKDINTFIQEPMHALNVNDRVNDLVEKYKGDGVEPTKQDRPSFD